jgi:hypothetical protein
MNYFQHIFAAAELFAVIGIASLIQSLPLLQALPHQTLASRQSRGDAALLDGQTYDLSWFLSIFFGDLLVIGRSSRALYYMSTPSTLESSAPRECKRVVQSHPVV